MDKFNDLKLFVDRRFFTNTYLLYKNNKCVVIDPSINDDKIISFLQQHNLKLVGIILTHAHYDHIGNSFTLAKQHDVKIYISKYEWQTLKDGTCANELGAQPPYIDKLLIVDINRNTLTIDNFNFDILYFAGHTPGGICLKYQNYVFSGDSIFFNAIGRTDLIYGNQNDMNKNIKIFLNTYSDENIIFPGHGQSGTLKEIKQNNTFL